MSILRLSVACAFLAVFLLAGCGNKADLFLPPPPGDETFIDDSDEQDFPDGPLDEDAFDDDIPPPEPPGAA